MYKINFNPFSKKAAPFIGLAVLEPVRAYLEHVLEKLIPKRFQHNGNQTPVIIIPGLGAGRKAMLKVHQRLAGWNYAPHDWGMGRNKGPADFDFDKYLEPLMRKIDNLYATTGKPIVLLGWSLGGLVAREAAKRRPGQIQGVITLATPMRGLITDTNALWLYEHFHKKKLFMPEDVKTEIQIEPPVPTVAVFSKTDGMVNWRTCIQKEAQYTKHVCINTSSHIGMVFNRRVLTTIRKELQFFHDLPHALLHTEVPVKKEESTMVV